MKMVPIPELAQHLFPSNLLNSLLPSSMESDLLRNRIKIGVSSRGVGSLKEGRNGEQLVQDDFEIICWDVVTAPSTPDAWIGRSSEEMRPYVENTQTKKPLINENLKDKLDKFLSD
jgi:hypothetical protein